MISSCRCLCARAALCLAALACSVLPWCGQTTVLVVDSEPGDYVGQGLQRTFTPADLTFTGTVSFDRSVVTISARTSSFSDRWDLSFSAPDARDASCPELSNTIS
jgi:hypothetical protein